MLSDDQFILELLNSEGWIQYIGDRGVRTTLEAKSYISEILKKTTVQYSVIEKLNSCIPIGILSFMKSDHLDSPDFGFALLPDYYKKGYAKEASIGFLQHLFNEQTKLNVLAICREDNVASITLLEKLGFKYSHKTEDDGIQLLVYDLKRQNVIH